ncbi:hypothetical protein HYT92_02495 [Candidatus Pacearchaeota archaeon]|nr:hypothetical protein [Candidatus Pacearchaeota archaeon]
MKYAKSQLFSETFKYILAGVFSVLILMAGYKSVRLVQHRSCAAEIKGFELELGDMGKSLRYATKELKSYVVPCGARSIYLFDLSRTIDLEQFNKLPIMKDSLRTSRNHNIFLIKENEVIDSFYAGSLEIENPHYLCLLAKNEKISFFAEGAANAAKITLSDEQARC